MLIFLKMYVSNKLDKTVWGMSVYSLPWGNVEGELIFQVLTIPAPLYILM